MPWVYDDGGRALAGFKGSARDCVARSIAIAADLPYRDVYERLALGEQDAGRSRSARNGVYRKVYDSYLIDLGFVWTPAMFIGSGCQMHLHPEEIPEGRLVLSLSKHMTAVIDGVVHDTHDPSRNGTRCVYGYWSLS